VNAKRLIVALVAAVTLTLFMAAAGAQQLAASQPAAEQDGDPADAFFDRIEAEEEAVEEEEGAEEAREEAREEAAEAKEKAEEAREEAEEGD
jgi:predicted kinase